MPTTINDKEYLSEQEAADLLNITKAKLTNWRFKGSPFIPFFKFGKPVYYDRNDILEFIQKSKTTSKSSK